MNDPHHRKIELQAPADLTYLLTNIRASARQKLDSAFPPSAAPKGEEDALRAKVEELVQTVPPQIQHPKYPQNNASLLTVHQRHPRPRPPLPLNQRPRSRLLPFATATPEY